MDETFTLPTTAEERLQLRDETAKGKAIAFKVFIPFVTAWADKVTDRVAYPNIAADLELANEMAISILGAAAAGRYEPMTDREVLACLKVDELNKEFVKLLDLLNLCRTDGEIAGVLEAPMIDFVQVLRLLTIVARPLLA
jgi:hypothetical protein